MQPVGYVYRAAIICPDCAQSLSFPYYDRDMGQEIASTDDMNAVFSTEETDCPQCCDICLSFIDSTLTMDGAEYVKEAIRTGNAPREWKDRWSFLANA